MDNDYIAILELAEERADPCRPHIASKVEELGMRMRYSYVTD